MVLSAHITILYSIQLINTKSISFPIKINYNIKTILIKGMLGSSKVEINFCLDLASNYSIIFDLQEYIDKNSTTPEKNYFIRIKNSFFLLRR